MVRRSSRLGESCVFVGLCIRNFARLLTRCQSVHGNIDLHLELNLYCLDDGGRLRLVTTPLHE